MVVRLEHLVRYHEDGNDILFRIVERDESWVHHFIPEAKVTSMARKNSSLPVRKKFITTPSVDGYAWPFEAANSPFLLNIFPF
ncbi:histone-lysine N-methyltransferase SETMAR [Trichonephila inaurata madagascariensis]|uniref:Histone-lysine N-methyltransferase SETMAR n=1 Tax=Trichonephila inaurata madagascariensis TaxID=2747483 RepID=A0A8X6YHI4_9ARAC|nr:histone-lysine N-methyltransferase SETMAR [Trichonephila inaurata madagascariensis]